MGSTGVEMSLLKRMIKVHRSYIVTMDDQIQQYLSLYSDIEEETHEMEARIGKNRSRLEALDEKLTGIREKRDGIIKDLISLSNQLPAVPPLPDELILRIFVEAIEAEEAERRHLAIQWLDYSLGKMPLTLSAVCRRWRRIATGTPTLWRYINLVSEPEEESSDEDTDYEKDRDDPPSLDLWLQYGSSTDIEVSLDLWTERHHTSLPSSLARAFRRPQIRRIEVSYGDGRETCGYRWPSRYPLAEEVTLLARNNGTMNDFFYPLIRQAKRLILSRINPSWKHMTSNSLMDLTILGTDRLPSPPDILYIFKELPNLSRLFITWEPIDTDLSKAIQPPLIHEQFQSLSCAFEAIEMYMYPFQRLIICPNLTEIIFLTLPNVTPSLLHAWTTVFNSITAFPLRHLQLPQIKQDAINHLISLFAYLPCLERLTLTGNGTDELIQRLIIDDPMSSTSISLSSLTRLDIRDADVTDVTLERLIISRHTLGRRVREINEVNIYECPMVTPQGWQRILGLLKTTRKG